MPEFGLGRRPSPDDRHVRAFPLSAIQPETIPTVERTLDLPTQYVSWYDQGAEGACVGFSCSWMMSLLNRRKYAARKLYLSAQGIDEWADTPPEEGTSVRAGCEILRTVGHWRFFRGLERIAGLFEGIQAYRWATDADQLRTAIANGIPFVLGVNWYTTFFVPQQRSRFDWWIGEGDSWGVVAGGHAICGYAASDRRQAFRLVNSWGDAYPRVWIAYSAVNRLIAENGEAALVTDR